jgi:hypothetical protein
LDKSAGESLQAFLRGRVSGFDRLTPPVELSGYYQWFLRDRVPGAAAASREYAVT